MSRYAKHISVRRTPQTQPIPGKPMVPNSAGGYAFALDDWKRLDRFLILGAEGGTYYVSERALTVDNAAVVARCAKADHKRTVDRIVEISDAGRAPKNDPAVFALAMCATCDHADTRHYALAALPKVCRIGTHLFQFLSAVQQIGKWNRSLRRAVGRWYTDRVPDNLAMQLVKYQSRGRFTHRDALRLAHPKTKPGLTRDLIAYAAGKAESTPHVRLVEAFQEAKIADERRIVELIREADLPRECVPTQHLTSPKVWDAMLPRMPMTAMIRNLGNLSKCGLLAPLSDASNLVCAKLADRDALRKARVHPVAVLIALKTYASGVSLRGDGAWPVVPAVVDALDGAFYAAFDNVEPTGKRFLIGVDVSGSMASPCGGLPISCAEGAAAMAMTVARAEPSYYCHGFAGDFVNLGITPRMRMDDVLKRTRLMNFGTTDCAVPMLYAINNQLLVDVFVVITDNETWAGSVHPTQALGQYRRQSGINAKLVVIGMTATEFTIADPSDAGMLDICGFDAGVPSVLGEFAKG